MKKLFPMMMTCPRPEQIIGILISWIMILVFIPFAIPVFIYQAADNLRLLCWVEVGYMLFSGAAVVILLKSHLSDALLDLQVQPRGIFRHVAVTVGLMIGAILLCGAVAVGTGIQLRTVLGAFPMIHLTVMISPIYFLQEIPIVGTVCLSVVGSLAFCGLFYATGFAPVCCRVSWLGYVNVAFMILLTTLFEALWHGYGSFVIRVYLLRLPVHLIACWSYQKTDNIWTPILSLSVLNLLTSFANFFLA